MINNRVPTFTGGGPLDDRPQQGDKIGVTWHGARASASSTLQVPLFVRAPVSVH